MTHKREVALRFSKYLAVFLVLSLVVPALATECLGAGWELNGKALKTSPMAGTNLVAFIDAVKSLDDKGIQKPEIQKRFQTVNQLGQAMKGDCAAFVARLKANHEEAAFDALALEKAGSFASELKAAGGAVAVLSQAGKHLDRTLIDIQGELKLGSAGWLDQILSVREAHAKAGRVLCQVFIWAVSFGSAPDAAGKICGV
jgi:hypothetical protein